MADSEDTTSARLSRRSLLAGGGGVLLAGGTVAQRSAAFRAWSESVVVSDALAEEAVRLERSGADTAVIERACERSEEADRACDLATHRMLAQRPDSLGGLVEKAHCMRWRMEATADRELMGRLIGDMVRVAGV
ncbi:hypothetical protein [Azospirillum sp. TSO22-1]|uniref:hypothetical protein n=1 Tax=Azospirillum sp. TSO22-1 TaxID=716789 RepID=UPI000D610C9C|nr:hypothetical protein [Azospirillum sp. TSO22-1]PWC45729.1 hypothetical protein TSO221_16325 [Azospirillum sp. TSO22-1]